MTLEERAAKITAEMESVFGSLRDSRRAAAEAFTGTHTGLMDGAL